MLKCPGQDSRNWKNDDIHLVPCPACGKDVEFFKDDRSRKCSNCGTRFKNPHFDIGCAEWCPYSKECIDFKGED